MNRVIKMESCNGRKGMEELYKAADKIFLLPLFDDIILYLLKDVRPEIPTELENDLFQECAVGRMESTSGEKWILIETKDERLIKIAFNKVIIYFKTASRNASQQTAAEILWYQQWFSSTNDNVCRIFFEDGTVLTNSEITPKEINPSGHFDEKYPKKETTMCDCSYKKYEAGGDGFSLYYNDYGPENPWDAPGMSIGDFIKGVK